MSSPAEPDHIPLSTYRVQLQSDQFRFDDVNEIVGYLSRLGIGDIYPSPLFRARSDSSHGYDVVDHGAIEPRFGGEDGLTRLCRRLRDYGMGLLLDVVPNHMGIDDPLNDWWQDVLAHGEGSRFAGYFDIDWNPPVESMKHCVLLPILGDYFGRVLERGELRLNYERGRFWVHYYQRAFPVASATWPPILRYMLESCDLALDDPDRMELESLITALDRMPAATERSREKMRERYRESEVASRRLRELVYGSTTIQHLLDAALNEYNGVEGEPRSFDRLEALLNAQPYRLAYWRVAGDEINYRRFFDINELAAIRVEEPAVFEAVHALAFRLLAEGKVTGLRIDHPDGLYDPPRYFEDLQAGYRRAIREYAQDGEHSDGGVVPMREREHQLYIVVEKILAHHERLDPDWPVSGTTGYEFLNALNGLFIAEGGAESMRSVYERFTGNHEPFQTTLNEGKRAILDFSMSSEVRVLARMLSRISGRRRESHDFTHGALERALREVVAAFNVYRTYVRPGENEIRAEDRRQVMAAIRRARRRTPELPKVIFDFLAGILLLDDPEDLTEEQREERRKFVLKLQQITGPVMAKGLEDTAFYRYYPLASLNEVGGEPNDDGVTPAELHDVFQDRVRREPFALSATATHDMKRGEDVRARLNVLSEVPSQWEQALNRWRYLNASAHTDFDGTIAPSPNEDYLIYQTLVGTWPGGVEPSEEYVTRIVRYVEKAFREAKLHTSWLDPDSEYEEAIFAFVRQILDPNQSSDFLADLDEFVNRIANAGYLNGLSQVVAKTMAPGVPDFYQGCELWDFRLVDPDNRGLVDFAQRDSILSQLEAAAEDDRNALARTLLNDWPGEALKLFITWTTLRLRTDHPDLFLHGNYVPLSVIGERQSHVFGFTRTDEQYSVLVVIPRLMQEADWDDGVVIDPAWWGDSVIELPANAPTQWRNIFTGRMMSVSGRGNVSELLADFPIGVWLGHSTN